MKLCMNRTAEERYETCKRMQLLICACMLVFAGITIYNVVTKTPISESFASFLCVSVCLLGANEVNKKRCLKEMQATEDK